ncbi:hypothetical protein N9J02_01690 [bacterium]|jgi:hypothetical protein|nr:hypothetical protein [bacterium]
MFVIKNTQTGRIHREPTRKSYASTSYKSVAAAKAGITRTVKYYQKAIADVKQTVADGNPDYMSRYYYDARDATSEPSEYGRGYDMRLVADGSGLEIMSEEQYGDPQVTRTGTSPYDGREITVTIGINEVGTHMDPLCESHYTR